MESNRRLQLSKLKRQEWLAKKLKDEIEAKLKEEKLSARKEKEQVRNSFLSPTHIWRFLKRKSD